MPTSILVTGADSAERLRKAEELAKEKSSPFDTILIDTNEEKGIASAKEIISKVSQKPFESLLTTVIVSEAQNLTNEAQNALLKTLEEPPEKAQLILTTPSSDSVLPTIASRCLELKLTKTSEDTGKLSLTDFSLSQRLVQIEQNSLEPLIAHFEKCLLEEATKKNEQERLQKTHRYLKILLKLKKAEKFSVNKKLIALIAATEIPTET